MNKVQNISTVACLVLSVLVNLAFYLGRKPSTESPKAITATSFRLVDKDGRLRARLDFLGNNPRLQLLDESENDVVDLAIAGYGEGMLTFNSTSMGNERYGIVNVGYLTGSDTDAKDDPLGVWGVGVRLSPTQKSPTQKVALVLRRAAIRYCQHRLIERSRR